MKILPRAQSFIYFILAAVSIITVTILLVLPAETFPKVDIISIDKVVHIIIFGAMLFNFYMWKPEYKMQMLIVGVAYGVAMEFVQKYWCINRSFSVADMVADAIGCLAGLGLAYLKLKYEKK